jgi:hypothetical protein
MTFYTKRKRFSDDLVNKKIFFFVGAEQLATLPGQQLCEGPFYPHGPGKLKYLLSGKVVRVLFNELTVLLSVNNKGEEFYVTITEDDEFFFDKSEAMSKCITGSDKYNDGGDDNDGSENNCKSDSPSLEDYAEFINLYANLLKGLFNGFTGKGL